MVKFQPSTLAMWVRFPLPALKQVKTRTSDKTSAANEKSNRKMHC